MFDLAFAIAIAFVGAAAPSENVSERYVTLTPKCVLALVETTTRLSQLHRELESEGLSAPPFLEYYDSFGCEDGSDLVVVVIINVWGTVKIRRSYYFDPKTIRIVKEL